MSTQYPEDRLQKLADLRAAGVDPYPAAPPTARELASEVLESFDAREGEVVTICGRVLGRRGYGKLAFLDLDDISGRIQAVMEKALVEEGSFALLKQLNLGDFIEVTGTLKKTQKGQASVYGTRMRILCKALLDPPAKWHGMSDVELRARMRYVDLFANEGIRPHFLKRSAVLSSIRNTLAQHNYNEVETPVLHPIYGGANARPFHTHHNTLDMGLYLRIAPELYLKRLLVGGLERVFELARVFRNEGISNRHNPEFTMLEFYEAYADFSIMADRTEQIVVEAARAAGCEQEDGSLQANFREENFNLATPFQRIRYADAFLEHVGIEATDREALVERLKTEGIEVTGEGDYFWWKAVNNLFERFAEPQLRGPVFVTHYPAAICPLAKPSAEDPTWAERFEFFLGGMELANAFSELNDPEQQLENFERQVQDSDEEAPNAVDYDYVRALAYGMPPAGGCGIGIDRLVMILLGSDSIRDVLLFPLMRPDED
ncbi:MAG TPA: lysine--tRNA ligase [Planctomycetota bacterium]|jgi:lysyl-tRNA synthetase class 2|nr:lysine--tRNA ligase [Planctomycetota bacterium]HJM39981.1 lysine--tRNA ligase [Planctomycetota bacterium]